jgi:hypothetical protein
MPSLTGITSSHARFDPHGHWQGGCLAGISWGPHMARKKHELALDAGFELGRLLAGASDLCLHSVSRGVAEVGPKRTDVERRLLRKLRHARTSGARSLDSMWGAQAGSPF